MANILKCKTCGKRSKRNYVTKNVEKAKNNREFKDCLANKHEFKVEKVY